MTQGSNSDKEIAAYRHDGRRLLAWFAVSIGAIVTYTLAAIDNVPLWTLWPPLLLAAIGAYKCWTVDDA